MQFSPPIAENIVCNLYQLSIIYVFDYQVGIRLFRRYAMNYLLSYPDNVLVIFSQYCSYIQLSKYVPTFY